MDLTAEWLEADGRGGFASGTVGGARTRRYHALLLHATSPPTGRMVLVNGLEAWLDTEAGSFALSSQAYGPDVVHPDGASRIATFTAEPWPRWRFDLPGGLRVVQEITVPHGAAATVLGWRLEAGRAREARLRVRLLLSGRDYHALHAENDDLRMEPERHGDALVWRVYPDVPAIRVRANGAYRHEPLWYRGFRYDAERARGLDWSEDLASPGEWRFDLGAGPAVCLLAADGHAAAIGEPDEAPAACAERLRASEAARRAAFPSPLHRAADAYLVTRGAGRTIVAGYPWFTDWGRDTFIALRGLCLATGRLDVARDILLEWADAVSGGMLPNRFPDRGEAPEYNSVDASLWYVVAVGEYLARARGAGADAERARLEAAVDAILTGYADGARFGIRADGDGLLAAGEPGWQLTWMDAKVGDWVVTPRCGKPVEIQALWINALEGSAQRSRRWRVLAERARQSFTARFWDPDRGHLLDVVDVDHEPGRVDPAFRPNQILAVGGLPIAVLEGEPARRVVEQVERRLWTPLGLRSLAPEEPGYAPHYEGGVRERDGAYHQGTAWPWLATAFVEAWLRAHGDTPAQRREARERFLSPLLSHCDDAGLGHVSEIADASAPHLPRGCPFQAWSVGELLRMREEVLAPEGARRAAAGAAVDERPEGPHARARESHAGAASG